MDKWLINKRIVIISAIVLAILILTAVFGARLAASYYYKKGQEAYLQNNFSAAKSNFATSLIFDSKNPETYFFLGKIALGISTPEQDVFRAYADYGEASKYYEKAVLFDLEKENRRFYGITLDDLGNAYWQLSDFDKAREKYLEKLSKFPESSFWARYRIASDDFNRLNKPEEALEVLTPAQGLTKSDNDRSYLFKIYLMLARLNIYFDDYDDAERYAKLSLESVMEKDKKDWEVQTAHAILARSYGHQKKFSLAISEIKKANELSGSANTYNCVLALSYLDGENYSGAISVAEKAVKTDNDYIWSSCLRVLALSYLAQSDKLKAEKYLQDYLNFTENFTEKNIFVMRYRKQFSNELQKLK